MSSARPAPGPHPVDRRRPFAQNAGMLRLLPGGVFRREARWMLWLVLVPALAAFFIAIVWPWIARSFR
jgi:hypothetical protein